MTLMALRRVLYMVDSSVVDEPPAYHEYNFACTA
jgi:hypothetical protein